MNNSQKEVIANSFMNDATEHTLKIRFRLPNGEEFEAEGTREFIERERNYFLNLIGQQQVPNQSQNSDTLFQANKISELHMWEQLLRQDGETLIFRKRTKLTVPEAAILLIAGAKVLLNKEAYSALELAKSLKACGIQGGRLDRALTPELLAGRLIATGSKRGRSYNLSNEGSAKAFMLAERLQKLV